MVMSTVAVMLDRWEEKSLTVDFEKPFFFLNILRNVDFVHIVIQSQFLAEYVDLMAIGRARCVPTDTLLVFEWL